MGSSSTSLMWAVVLVLVGIMVTRFLWILFAAGIQGRIRRNILKSEVEIRLSILRSKAESLFRDIYLNEELEIINDLLKELGEYKVEDSPYWKSVKGEIDEIYKKYKEDLDKADNL